MEVKVRATNHVRANSGGGSMEKRKIGLQGRVALPDDVMESLGVGKGDHIFFDVEDGEAKVYSEEFVRNQVRS